MTNDVERLATAIAGRYTLERELGRGGMATVYLAQDVKHHREVAVKVLDPELTAAIGAARFLHEIEVAARLHHPHILPLHDSGNADGTLYYVMPYVEGESLQDKLRREGQLAIDEAIRIAREVAEALAYAHARGVLHRDIKPANIMLESEHAMVMDFGVALSARAATSQRLTLTGMSPGTPLYMSPEQASGDVHVDGRSDIYSLGSVLYEMLTGDPPFNASTHQAVLAKKLAEPVPSLRVVRDTVSPSLERVVIRALAKTPADRFRSAAEFAHALETAAHEQATSGPFTPAGTPSVGNAAATPATLGGTSVARSTLDGQTAPAPALARWLAIAAGTLVMLTTIGFVTTILYDVVMRIPSQYTPSRTDFPVLGVRALMPSIIYAFVVLIAFIVANHLVRLLWFGLRRNRRLRQTTEAWQQRIRAAFQRYRDAANPATVVDLYFLTTVAVSVIVLVLFRLQTAAGERWPSTEIFSCAYRPVHGFFQLVMTILVMGLAIAWWGTSRYLAVRNAYAPRIALARTAGLAWILILILFTTAPWRLLWSNERPRALLNGERVYILMEDDADLVLYNASRGVTQQYRLGDAPGLERLNAVGYVFESAEAFAGPRRGC